MWISQKLPLQEIILEASKQACTHQNYVFVFLKMPKIFLNAHEFPFFPRNLNQAKRKRVCSNEEKKKKATLNRLVELNLRNVILTGNTFAMLSLWWCSNKVLIACLCINSISEHSLCVWASSWLRRKPISTSWKTNYWYRRSLLSIAGVFLCFWTSTEKPTWSSGKVSSILWTSNWQETMLKTSQHLTICSENHFLKIQYRNI